MCVAVVMVFGRVLVVCARGHGCVRVRPLMGPIGSIGVVWQGLEGLGAGAA